MTTTSFRSMDESTAEQWAVIGARPSSTRTGSPTRSSAMLDELAGITDGFAVDQLTHCLQTATRAERDGADEEMVMAALCHDIGKVVSVPNHPRHRSRDPEALPEQRRHRRRPRAPGLPGPPLLPALRCGSRRPREVPRRILVRPLRGSSQTTGTRRASTRTTRPRTCPISSRSSAR